MRCDIPDILSDEGFVTALTEWHEFKSYGLPYAGGVKDQPCQWFDIIKVFNGLYDKHGGDNGG